MGKLLSKIEFIRKANQVHNNEYDYSKVVYKNSATKICIICPEHGEFWQTPGNHLRGNKCPKCANKIRNKNNIKTTEQFIKEAIEVHKNKYDYSKVNYKGAHIKVCIICPEHGEFWQTPHDHLDGHGCPKCGGTGKLTTQVFIERAKRIHNNKYDYSASKYINNLSLIKIICPIHGEFEQIASEHLRGHGCPMCKESSYEKDIAEELKKDKISFEPQKKFEWLKPQSLDFYLPKYNIAIECQGEQHFKSVEYWGGDDSFKKRVQLGKVELKKCKKHGIKILYYTNKKFAIKENFYTKSNIFFNKDELIKKIITEE